MERQASNKGVDSYKHQRLDAITVKTALPEHILDLQGAGAMQEGRRGADQLSWKLWRTPALTLGQPSANKVHHSSDVR